LATITQASAIGLQLAKVFFELRSAEEPGWRVGSVPPPQAAWALRHPFARAWILQIPLGIVLFLLHLYFGLFPLDFIL
jgi:hypothetical protein